MKIFQTHSASRKLASVHAPRFEFKCTLMYLSHIKWFIISDPDGWLIEWYQKWNWVSGKSSIWANTARKNCTYSYYARPFCVDRAATPARASNRRAPNAQCRPKRSGRCWKPIDDDDCVELMNLIERCQHRSSSDKRRCWAGIADDAGDATRRPMMTMMQVMDRPSCFGGYHPVSTVLQDFRHTTGWTQARISTRNLDKIIFKKKS